MNAGDRVQTSPGCSAEWAGTVGTLLDPAPDRFGLVAVRNDRNEIGLVPAQALEPVVAWPAGWFNVYTDGMGCRYPTRVDAAANTVTVATHDFAATATRRTDPETSHDAAVMVSGSAPGDRELALRHLAAAGPLGLTDHELAARTNRLQTSIGKRRHDLMQPEHGAVITALLNPNTGRQIRRTTPTGALAGVWIHIDHDPNRTNP